MAENPLLGQIEQKILTLLTEVERLSNEKQQLSQQVNSLMSQSETQTKKLQDLLSILETVDTAESSYSMAVGSDSKPVLV